MRVSSLQYYQSNVGKITEMQGNLVKLQDQISSGEGLTRPSDDPTRIFEGIQAQRGVDRVQQFNRNILFARSQLEQFDNSLGNLTDNLVEVKSLLVQAKNGTNNQANKDSIAQALEGLRNDIFSNLNRKDFSGRYLYSGKEEFNPPYASSSNPGSYNGEIPVAGESAGLTVEVGEGVLVNLGITARDLVVLEDQVPAAPPAAGTPESNIFTAMDKIIASLRGSPTSGALDLDEGSQEVDTIFDQVQNNRSSLGIRLAGLDANEALNAADEITFESLRSKAVDTDMAKAISEFVQAQTQTQAFQQTYANISKLSLFNFIA